MNLLRRLFGFKRGPVIAVRYAGDFAYVAQCGRVCVVADTAEKAKRECAAKLKGQL